MLIGTLQLRELVKFYFYLFLANLSIYSFFSQDEVMVAVVFFFFQEIL